MKILYRIQIYIGCLLFTSLTATMLSRTKTIFLLTFFFHNFKILLSYNEVIRIYNVYFYFFSIAFFLRLKIFLLLIFVCVIFELVQTFNKNDFHQFVTAISENCVCRCLIVDAIKIKFCNKF